MACSSKLSLETKMVYERVFESTHTRKQEYLKKNDYLKELFTTIINHV